MSRSICHKKNLTTVAKLFFSNFTRFQRGFNIFSRGGGGGPTFSRGIQLLIPYRLPYNLCFSRGVRVPCPPPPPTKDQRMQYLDQLDDMTKVRYEKKLSIFTPPPPLGIPKCIHGVCKNNHSGLSRIQIVFPGSDNLGVHGVQTPLKKIKYRVSFK